MCILMVMLNEILLDLFLKMSVILVNYLMLL